LIYQLGYSADFTSFADRIESDVKPLASMDFAPTIDKLVKYLRKTSSSSIFDQLGSYTYGLDTFGEVTGHCVLVSRES